MALLQTKYTQKNRVAIRYITNHLSYMYNRYNTQTNWKTVSNFCVNYAYKERLSVTGKPFEISETQFW